MNPSSNLPNWCFHCYLQNQSQFPSISGFALYLGHRYPFLILGSSATLALMILTLHQVPSNPGHKRHLCGLMAFFSTKPSSQNAFLPQSCVSAVVPNPRQGITRMESNWGQGLPYSECVYRIESNYRVQCPYIIKYAVYAHICEIIKAGGISLHTSIALWSCSKVKTWTQPSLLCRTSTALT